MLASFLAALLALPGSGESYRTTHVRVGKMPRAIAVVDVDEDGKPDLVVANGGSGDVSVLLGDGRGGFRPAPGSPFPAGKEPNDVAAVDVNHDKHVDLVFANHDSQHLTLLLGDGHGKFVPAPSSPIAVHSRPHPHGVAAGDFDGDGNVDLATESWGENEVIVLFGDGKGGFASPGVTFPVGRMPYQRLRAADLLGDGRAEIVTTNLEGASVTVLVPDGKRGFRQPPGSPFPAGRSPFGLAIGDVNGDRKLDLVVGNWGGQPMDRSADAVNVLLGDGKGGFSPAPDSPFRAGHASAGVAISDLDGDGIADVVVANYAGDDVTVFIGGKSGLRRGPTLRVGPWPAGVAVADLNGDGKGDIVTPDSEGDTITLLLSAGGPRR